MLGKIAFIINELNSIIDDLKSQQNYDTNLIISELNSINKILRKHKKDSNPFPTELIQQKKDLLNQLSNSEKAKENLRLLRNELGVSLNKIRESPKLGDNQNHRKRNYKGRIDPKTPITPYEDLEKVLLQVLKKNGGSANKDEVISNIESLLMTSFTRADLEKISSGQIRWISRLYFIRHKLIKNGIIEKNSKPGIWELKK